MVPGDVDDVDDMLRAILAERYEMEEARLPPKDVVSRDGVCDESEPCPPGYIRDEETCECYAPGCGCPIDPRYWYYPPRPCRSFYCGNALNHRGLYDNVAYK